MDQGSIEPSRIMKTFIIHYPIVTKTWKTKSRLWYSLFMQFIASCRLVVYFCSDPSSYVFFPNKKYIYLSWNWPCMNAFEKCPLFKVSLSLNRHWIILTGTLSRAADWQNEWLQLHAALPVIDRVGAKIICNLCRSKGLRIKTRKKKRCMQVIY